LPSASSARLTVARLGRRSLARGPDTESITLAFAAVECDVQRVGGFRRAGAEAQKQHPVHAEDLGLREVGYLKVALVGLEAAP
jgi:hypothetical protein